MGYTRQKERERSGQEKSEKKESLNVLHPEEKLQGDKEQNLEQTETDRVVDVTPKWGLFVQTWAPCPVFPSYLWSELYSLSYIAPASRLQLEWLSGVIL